MTTKFKLIVLLQAGLLVLAGCTAVEAPDCGGIELADVWVRQAPPGTPVEAGYFIATNGGGDIIVVHGVDSPDFGRVEMHETVGGGAGSTRMRAVDKFEIPPRSTVQFRAGAKHLMLFEPRLEYSVGDRVQLQFICGAERARIPVNAEIRSSGPVGEDVSRP